MALDRAAAHAQLEGADLVACLSGAVPQAKELERCLLAHDIPARLARPAAKGCCAGGCSCGGKLEVLVRPGDVARVRALLDEEWRESLRREGTVAEAALGDFDPAGEGEPPCPACGFEGELVGGACSDCGLQLA